MKSRSRIKYYSNRGMTLIEVIMFVAIAGLVMAAMVQAFSGTSRGGHVGKEMTQSTQLAQQRMEIILGQRKLFGYTGFIAANYDPCKLAIAPWPTTQACSTSTTPAGNYVVDSTFADPGPCGSECKQVVVTVTHPINGKLAELTMHLWNY